MSPAAPKRLQLPPQTAGEVVQERRGVARCGHPDAEVVERLERASAGVGAWNGCGNYEIDLAP